MRRFVVAMLAAVSLIAWSVVPAAAQGTKTTRGTVSAVSADSLTVKVGSTDMKFAVDGKTTVEARGAGTASKKDAASGKAGISITDTIQVGQAVEVSYSDMGGTLHASKVRRVASPGNAGAPPNRASGKVSAVSATSLTVNGSAGSGASFTQTYVIDDKTKVIGKGAGTMAKAKGGKIAANDLIATGDTVSVSFHDMSGTLHASEVRVVAKATK